MLAIPNSEQEFRMKVNMFGYTIGGVLSQQQKDNSWRPISYLSQTIKKTEIVHWDKQQDVVPAPNCTLKVQGKIAEMKVLNKKRNEVLYAALGNIK